MGLSKASGLFELWLHGIVVSEAELRRLEKRCGCSVTAREIGVLLSQQLCILGFARVPPLNSTTCKTITAKELLPQR